jgi:hypothetical protein
MQKLDSLDGVVEHVKSEVPSPENVLVLHHIKKSAAVTKFQNNAEHWSHTHSVE